MSTVIDLMTRLPVEIWVEENPKASETKLGENILNLVTENTLLQYAPQQKDKPLKGGLEAKHWAQCR